MAEKEATMPFDLREQDTVARAVRSVQQPHAEDCFSCVPATPDAHVLLED